MPADNGRFCLFTEILAGPYRDLLLADVSTEDEEAMPPFPLGISEDLLNGCEPLTLQRPSSAYRQDQ